MSSEQSSNPVQPPVLREIRAADSVRRLELTGAWNLRGITALAGQLQSQLDKYATDPALHWDLQGITQLDKAGAVLLNQGWGRHKPQQISLRPEHAALFEQIESLPPLAEERKPRDFLAPLRVLGNAALIFLDHLTGFIALLGQLVLDCGYLLTHPRRIPWREFSANLFRTGAQALAITGLVSILIGVVLSYLFSQQLRVFGADIYIINILGISVFRELGPVLAAIIVAGRSGASITAQLGVMRVTQELDALAVMGISRSVRLILPKVLALTIALPLLVLWADAVALLGGALAANIELGIGIEFFISSLPAAVPVANIWLGVIKGAVFGLFIALMACHFGLRILPNTESLGVGTTTSVVTSITVVLMVDAVFAVLFSDVGVGL